MDVRIITKETVERFTCYLVHEEKSEATCEKYVRDVQRFQRFAGEKSITKELVAAYKKSCLEKGYAVRSINSMLASINSMLNFLGWSDCKVKNIRFQRQTYCTEDKELTKTEYLRLLEASKFDMQMNLILQSLGGTGIRVSEIRYFTVEAVRRGEITIHCKNKTRTIIVPGKLKKLLLAFARKRAITSGAIFVSRSGRPLDRSNIWRRMKRLCERANVKATKIFPHNLRKLFARTFYSMEKDIAKLADLLGHSSINTTRIYIIVTGMEHRRKMERLGLIV